MAQADSVPSAIRVLITGAGPNPSTLAGRPTPSWRGPPCSQSRSISTLSISRSASTTGQCQPIWSRTQRRTLPAVLI